MYCGVCLYFGAFFFYLQFEWLLTGMCEQVVIFLFSSSLPSQEARLIRLLDLIRLDLHSSFIESSLKLFKHFSSQAQVQILRLDRARARVEYSNIIVRARFDSSTSLFRTVDGGWSNPNLARLAQKKGRWVCSHLYLYAVQPDEPNLFNS